MKKMSVTYKVVNGTFRVNCFVSGEWVCGGDSGHSTYDGAFGFAEYMADQKGCRLERFGRA